MSSLLTAISIEGHDEAQVDLMSGSYRKVRRAEGLAGIRVREIVVPRVGRRGSRNRTRHRDDAQIVLTGIIWGEDADRAWLEYDTVARALASAVDTDRLLMWSAGARDLQQDVRLSSFDGPIEVGPSMIAYQCTLRASDPNAYTQTAASGSGNVLGSSSGGGMTMPVTFPFTFDPLASSTAAVANTGTVPTPGIYELAGYLSDPIVRLDDGTEIVLAGEIAAGDTLTIDVEARTVVLNGTENRRNMVDSSLSTWSDLPVGTSAVTLFATDFTAGASLTVRYRPAYE